MQFKLALKQTGWHDSTASNEVWGLKLHCTIWDKLKTFPFAMDNAPAAPMATWICATSPYSHAHSPAHPSCPLPAFMPPRPLLQLRLAGMDYNASFLQGGVNMFYSTFTTFPVSQGIVPIQGAPSIAP